MHRGYTKRWRKRWDKGYHYDPDLWLLMDYFIDHANYRDTRVFFPGCGLIPLKRGQHIFGTPQLSVFMRWDRGRTRRKLKILKNIGFLTIKTTNKYSIASVINYDTYQPTDQQNDQQNDTWTTSRRPADDQQTTTPKEYKKDKKVKKVKNNNPPYIPPGGNELAGNGCEWINSASWDEFVSHRVEIKKPLTALSVKKALNLLEANQGEQVEIIDNTIMNRWTGLFKLKSKKPDGWDKLRKEFCE